MIYALITFGIIILYLFVQLQALSNENNAQHELNIEVHNVLDSQATFNENIAKVLEKRGMVL